MDQFMNNNEFNGDTTDFGLPLDLGEIEVRKSDEFEATQEITRSIEVESFPTSGAELEFQPSFGSNFVASSSLFTSSVEKAPTLPFYYKPSKTHFRSNLTLATQRMEIEEALSECSVEYSVRNCTYNCSLEQINFEVRIFSTTMGSLLVEFQHLSGCRWAFSQFTSTFESVAQISWGVNGSVKVGAPLAPMELDDLQMPALQSAFGFDCPQLVSCSA